MHKAPRPWAVIPRRRPRHGSALLALRCADPQPLQSPNTARAGLRPEEHARSRPRGAPAAPLRERKLQTGVHFAGHTERGSDAARQTNKPGSSRAHTRCGGSCEPSRRPQVRPSLSGQRIKSAGDSVVRIISDGCHTTHLTASKTCSEKTPESRHSSVLFCLTRQKLVRTMP
jgi:hypothetical protein